ncbi:3-alpha,7-alpha,12-alpha-trihydroxy-5-beta-cholest-24-enoyl-CoA hydratase [Actinomadura sp. DSM 109109]|nr:3-alpha,7-alpha,12-alpha-trihydroxy-5-beta-cholest-24-enoyl-CoA hydratase [Actinomadura lepetitiana]
MSINPTVAIGATLPEQTFAWDSSDVVRYHLALGAGADRVEPNELRYVLERELRVLPTFGMTVPAVFGVAAPAAFGPGAPRTGRDGAREMSVPGVDVDLSALLHGRQELVVHRPIPVAGEAVARTRVVDVHDKGDAAVIVQETEVVGVDGGPLFTAGSSIFARGEGGFGGRRGPSAADRPAPPAREPDAVLDTPTLPQQALLYQLCGDRNPLHADPARAREAGFPGPILQGACTYGMVCKAVVDTLLEGDASRILRYSARFTGVVFPGETLRTRVWRTGDRLALTTCVLDRGEAPVLTDAAITAREN